MIGARYQRLFAALREKGEGAFVPFLVLGDPDLETSLAIAETLIAAGADALELGLPFSDPVADGPVIQAAGQRALAAGATPARCFSLVATLRARHPALPLGLLAYANLVHRQGISPFYRRAAAAGLDAVLVADVPLAESAPFARAAEEAGIAPVLIAPPNAPPATTQRIAATTHAFTYLLGRPGVTGTEREVRIPEAGWLDSLRAAGAPPLLLGFGISRPEHVRAALAAGVDGVICGSAVVARIADHEGPALHEALRAFTQRMKAATLPQEEAAKVRGAAR